MTAQQASTAETEAGGNGAAPVAHGAGATQVAGGPGGPGGPSDLATAGPRPTWPSWLGVEEATTPGPDGSLAVGEHWSGFGGAHGGLLVAAAARSMATAVPAERALRSIHADLLGAVSAGSLALEPVVEREGRAVSFARVSGTQAGRVRLTASGVFGDTAGAVAYGPSEPMRMPAVPPPSMCEPLIVRGGPALGTIEYRPARDPLPLSGYAVADLHVWVRIHGDERSVDRARALILLDAPAPGLYATLTTPIPIPTIEFTAHLLPALEQVESPWALARMRTLVAGDGYCIDDCELWSEAGELLATSRQLRRVMG